MPARIAKHTGFLHPSESSFNVKLKYINFTIDIFNLQCHCAHGNQPMAISRTTCPECNQPFRITRLACPTCNLAMEGQIELSPLDQLAPEDQAFVMAFVRHHGSIKKMEELFGISYPTVKNRLNAIAARLDKSLQAPSAREYVLEQLSRGEINVDEALEKLG
jgi:hypothetical protein